MGSVGNEGKLIDRGAYASDRSARIIPREGKSDAARYRNRHKD
jgi:hypothetical protein